MQKDECILIVGEDPVLVQGLQRRLSRWGIPSELLGAGEDVLEKISVRGCSLVLSDLNLPGLRGWEVLARIRQSFPEIPVVVISDRVDSALLKELGSLGVYRVAEKAGFLEEAEKIIAEQLAKSALRRLVR